MTASPELEGTDDWFSMDGPEATRRLGTSGDGLSSAEAKARLDRYGRNRLRERKEKTLWSEVAEELTEPMILLLLGIGILYSIWGKLEDGVTIFAVITVLVVVEIYNELRAEKTIEALNNLSEPTTTVRRDGEDVEVKNEEVVPGDILVLGAGRRVPADARLLESYGLEAEEAPLTGESLPLAKSVKSVAPKTPLAERMDMVFAGTVITRGRGTAMVTATGMGTELGRIAGLARREKPPRTVLQRTMDDLTKWMVVLALGFSALVPLLGFVVNHQDPQQMFLTGLSLAFATIPEELPIIITMVLAIGGYRLSKENAIIKKLQAVESLGAVTVIGADKTGTMTIGRLEVQEFYPEELKGRLLELSILANDIRKNRGELVGDPIDDALVKEAIRSGVDVEGLWSNRPLVTENTFDNIRKRMSVVYRRLDGLRVAVKGSPESVLDRCSSILEHDVIRPLDEGEKRIIADQAAAMAARGLRILAVAEKGAQERETGLGEVESGLTFVGLIGLVDSPRPEVKEAIARCAQAGIRVIMITGDHPLTARSIARQVGLESGERIATGSELDAMEKEELQRTVRAVNVFARATPEHKLRIVKALQAIGERVAVTGDGINDAPALSAADIGVAMGKGGTDVARESADMVLADNNFATITRAVKEGRVLFDNLTKGVRYYLACKVALIAVSLIGVLFFLPIPFTPVQIILLELFMDLGASAAFVAEQSEGDLMERRPRDPKARFMDRKMVGSIFLGSIGLIFAVAGGYLITWYSSNDLLRAQTVAFVTWLVGHVLLALNMRSQTQSIFRIGPFTNLTMVAWGLAAGAFAVAVTTVQPLYDAIKTTALPFSSWALVLALAIAGSFWLEVYKWGIRRRNAHWKRTEGSPITTANEQP